MPTFTTTDGATLAFTDEGSGHATNFDQPDVFNALLLDFLAGL
jgi:pimeloyl-ACP methyl ester carboxylesterase